MERLRKKELIWLILALVFYFLYNIPGVPAYGDGRGALLHALFTLIPLFAIGYGGQIIMMKEQKRTYSTIKEHNFKG